MTRNRAYIMTAIAAGLFVLLSVVFADGQFALSKGALWNSDAIGESTILTYLMLVVIIALGYWNARELPEQGLEIRHEGDKAAGQIDDPVWWKLFLGNVHYAILWVPIRFFVGREWAVAGEHKVRDDAWMSSGSALKGYLERQTTIPEGRATSPAGTYGWFEDFLAYMLRNEWYTWFAKIVALGELLVGIGLVVGALVGIAAFFGTLMNFNFQLAGSASTNPVLFGLGVFLILGWKVAGYLGLDRVLLPQLGTPWLRGRFFGHKDVSFEPPHRTAPV